MLIAATLFQVASCKALLLVSHRRGSSSASPKQDVQQDPVVQQQLVLDVGDLALQDMSYN